MAAFEDDVLDGCDLDFDDLQQITDDGAEVDALVMFADCWHDPAAVKARRVELVEWNEVTDDA